MNYTRSFAQAGAILNANPVLQNAFYQILNEYVQLQLVNRLLNEDHLSWTVRGEVREGAGIREIYVPLIEGQAFSSEKQNYLFEADKFDVEEVFHPINWKVQYNRRYSLDEALISISAWNDLIDAFPRAMFDSLSVDLYIAHKYQIGRAIVDGIAATKSWDTTADPAEQNAAIKTVSTLMEYATSAPQFNQRGVENPTPKDQKHIVMTAAFQAERDSGFLASVFNLDKTELDTDYYNTVDSFALSDKEQARLTATMTDPDTGEVSEYYRPITAEENEFLATVPCCIFDERFFQNYRTRVNMAFDEFFAPNNRNRYLWLTHWMVLSTSPFHNAVVFLSGTNGLTAIEIAGISYDATHSGYVAATAATAIKDAGYAAGATVTTVTLPVAAIAEGSGLYPKLGAISPAEITCTLVSADNTVQDYIDKGLLKVIAAGNVGEVLDNSSKSYGSANAYDAITDRAAVYYVNIDASIRQAASGWTQRTATLTVTYKGVTGTASILF